MVNVTAKKIRDHGTEPSSIGVGRVYQGFLVSYPIIGEGMVIFRDPSGHRMITTPVRRIFGDPDSHKIYVETANSVYRLAIHSPNEEFDPPNLAPLPMVSETSR